MVVDDITVAIATCNDRIIHAADVANAFYELGFPVAILYQGFSDGWTQQRVKNLISSIQCKAPVFFVEGRGVAKSRNFALKSLSTKYVWFMDDDVSLCESEIRNFVDDVRLYSVDFITCEIVDENGVLRKKYPEDGRKHDRFSIQKVGTIEVVCDREAIQKAGILFPENMGAGTQYSVADEAVFLGRCIKVGKKGVHVKRFPVTHPLESSGTEYSENYMASKALAFKDVFGFFMSFPLSFSYLVRYVVSTKNYAMFYPGLRSMLKAIFGVKVL